MALVEANGLPVIEASICMPRTGAWHADVRVDSPDSLSGTVTLSIAGALTLVGAVVRGASYVESALVRIVGGAGGLGSPAKPKHYNGTSVRVVLRDLIAGAGEALSSTADEATLASRVPAWTTSAISTGRLIATLLESASPGSNWRVLTDGTIWVGPETWPDSGLTTPDDYQILDEDPRRGEAWLGVEAPRVLPGTTLGGRRVSYAEHRIGSDGVRSLVWFEDAGAPSGPDRLRAALSGAVAGSLPPLVYQSQHFAKVVSQSGSTIDVEIENPTIARFLPSMAGVPLMVPFAGAGVEVLAVGRVLVGWSNGDPSKPYALPAYDPSTVSKTIRIRADQIFIGDDSAEAAAKGQTLQTWLNTWTPIIAVHVHGGGTVSGSTTTSPALTAMRAPDIAAKKVKVT